MKQKTKLVRVTLAAMTRVEYSEVIEVPAEITEAQLDALVDQRYDAVDGGLYVSDPEYWERSKSCRHEEAEDHDAATAIVSLKNGAVIVQAVSCSLIST